MASYKDAISWIAEVDDTEWTEYPEDSASGTPSVTAHLVADVWGKSISLVRADIIRAIKRVNKQRKA